MGNFTFAVKQCWFRFIPFVISIAVYCALVQFQKTNLGWTAAVKCAPIIALMLFIALFGYQHLKLNPYPRRILLGLIFSSMGDILLDYDLFEFGVGGFLIAQLCYIWAFGWSPFMWWIGVTLYVVASAITGILLKYMDPVARFGLPFYALALTTMSWRALARIWLLEDGTFLGVRILCGIGSLLFVVSDGFIAVDKYYADIPNSGYYIMITYYVAQLGIALSAMPQDNPETKRLIVDERTDEPIDGEGRYVAKGSRLTD